MLSQVAQYFCRPTPIPHGGVDIDFPNANTVTTKLMLMPSDAVFVSDAVLDYIKLQRMVL
jgi:hypothetical protein